MKFKKLKKIILPFLILPILILVGCAQSSTPSIAETPIEEIKSTIPYQTVTNFGYMGGALPYVPNNPSVCPLRNGATLAVRCGYISKEAVDVDTYVYTDLIDKASFGLLKITSIGKDSVSFTIQFYDNNKVDYLLPKNSYTIYKDQELDINKDNIPDLKYYQPTDVRQGIESARYLSFLSDTDKLNTTMFSIIVDQYQHNDYPGGIIGINPNGNMILSKYTSTGARAALPYFRAGDYILDSELGEYQVVKSGVYSNGKPRAINDSEVQSLAETINYEFSVAEFFGKYNAKELYESIVNLLERPNQIGTNPTIEEYVSYLNELLMDRQLIKDFNNKHAFVSFNMDIEEILNTIPKLDDKGLIELNRAILEILYTNICPKLVAGTNVMLEVLPISYVSFGSGVSDKNEKTTEPKSARALSVSEYRTKKANLEEEFSKNYNIIGDKIKIPSFNNKYPTPGNSKLGVNFGISDTYLKFGIKGYHSNAHGCIKGSLKTALFVTADTSIENSSITFDKTLVDTEIEKKLPHVVAGPIIVGCTLKTGVKIPLKIKFSKSAPFSYRCGFTGLYQGGFFVSADYGVKRKGFLLKPYVNFDADSFKAHDTISYTAAGGDGGNMLPLDTGTIDIDVRITEDIDVDLCKFLTGGIQGDIGLNNRLQVKPTKETNKFTGKLTVTPNLATNAKARIGYETKVFGHKIGIAEEFSWELLQMKGKPIVDMTLF